MTDYKEILRLKNLGFSNNEVAAAVKMRTKHSLSHTEAGRKVFPDLA